jgi:two-component sensor histidine kinase
VEIAVEERVSILKESALYLDNSNRLHIQEIDDRGLFYPYTQSFINVGVDNTTIWIKFKLQNSSHNPVEKLLVLTSPILEEIELYTPNNLDTPRLKGTAHLTKEHTTIFPTYTIVLEAGQSQEYYLKVKNHWTPVAFSLFLKDKKVYYEEDKVDQIIKSMLLAMIIVLMVYTLLLSIYTQDRSYLYYAFYLLTLSYQQSTYLGLAQLYLPLYYISNIEIRLPVTEVSIMIIAASIFASTFLKTINILWLHYIYRGFMVVALLQIVILNIPQFYNLGIVMMTSILLIFFNIMASIISYQKGNQQARLFILGFSVVSLAYLAIISDSFGLTTIIEYFPNILMWATTFEALALTLAFADRYTILQAQKEKVDRDREQIIRDEVIEKTAQLHHALETKELLLKEVHHRIKNNLQIILSMIRLQSDKIEDAFVVDKFLNLENRINAISKTYNMLILGDNLEGIDMDEYIESLLEDIAESFCGVNDCSVEINLEIDTELPLEKSVYIGIIINELITNSYKYAFKEEGQIFISLHKETASYILIVRDSGDGFTYNIDNESLGLKLIYRLTTEQLRGTIEMNTDKNTEYIIRFAL